MVAAQYKHILGVKLLDEANVLINGVGCALVPFRAFAALIRRQDVHPARQAVEVPRLPVADIGV